jgi:hypothetical protein
MVIVGTSRLTHPTTSCSRRADRPRAGPTWELRSVVPAVIRCSLARPGAAPRGASGEEPRTWTRSGPASRGALPPGRRSARTKARRRSAACRHSGVGCMEATRQGSRRRGSGTRAPSRTTTRRRSLTGARFRHPTHVRTGEDVSAIDESSAWPVPDVPHGVVEAGARGIGHPRPAPGHPNAAAAARPRARAPRRGRRAGRRCGCRSGSP